MGRDYYSRSKTTNWRNSSLPPTSWAVFLRGDNKIFKKNKTEKTSALWGFSLTSKIRFVIIGERSAIAPVRPYYNNEIIIIIAVTVFYDFYSDFF